MKLLIKILILLLLNSCITYTELEDYNYIYHTKDTIFLEINNNQNLIFIKQQLNKKADTIKFNTLDHLVDYVANEKVVIIKN